MAKTILVFGATGQMGGSVAWRLLKEGWKVRAVTRNTGSEKAQALIKAGAEAVTADYGNEESLAKAFEVSLSVHLRKKGTLVLTALARAFMQPSS